MSNSAMPNLPGFGAIAETMELVRNMWGGMGSPGTGIPGMVMPTLSVDEINKQISDLKAVESWLTLNMNMLRGTIQALEVQSATISTLKTMSETFSNSAKAAAPASRPASGFSFPFGAAPTPASAPAPAPPPAPAAAPAESQWGAAIARPEPAPGVSRPVAAPAPVPAAAEQAAPPEKVSAGSGSPGDAPFAAPLANPAAWWSLLQDQFKQAVSTAMTPEPAAARKSATAGKAGSAKGKGASRQSAEEAGLPGAGESGVRTAAASAGKSGARSGVKPAGKKAVGGTKAAAKTTSRAAPRQR